MEVKILGHDINVLNDWIKWISKGAHALSSSEKGEPSFRFTQKACITISDLIFHT